MLSLLRVNKNYALKKCVAGESNFIVTSPMILRKK